MKFSKLMEDVIGDMAGGDVMPVVKNLKTEKMISEHQLAKKMDSELNILRRQLYKLHKHNIVNCKRKRTTDGMYEYYWAFNLKRLKNLIKYSNKNKLEELKEKLVKEENNSQKIKKLKQDIKKLI